MSSDFVSLFTGMSERDIGYLLKTMVQKTINEELTNTEISSIDNKTPVLITNSKDVELMNDISLQAAINVETFTPYYMVEEPDGNNLKVWLKFQNAGELRDWSYQKNKSFSTGANTMPGLFSKYNENSMMKYELYSYFNGLSHYAYTLDSTQVRILPNITASKITSFFMRFIPISLARVAYAENNSLFTKVDDDQLRYGYSVTVDQKGSIHFYIRNDYRQYHLYAKDAYNYLLTDPLWAQAPQFRFENYNKENFITGYEFLCNLVSQELPFHDWFFKYNPTTHSMTMINTSENNLASVISDTSLVTPAPVISLPIQEGKYKHDGTIQATIYDNSGNGHNATMVNIATGGTWNDDNTLTSSGLDTNNIQINLPSVSAINTLTEFTISFWFNPLDQLITPATSRYLIHKGISVAQSILIYRGPSVNDLRFVLYDTSSSDFATVIFPNAFPEVNKWYFVICKWKSGEKVKISVNNVSYIESSNTKTFTLTNSTNNLSLFRTTNSVKGKIALFKFYTTQISQTVQDNLYYQGYHNPLFPKSESIQPVVDPDPDPIFVPFTNVYNLDKMTTPVQADYRKINSLSGNNPFTQLHSVADGTSSTDPSVIQYNVPEGTTTGGDETPFTRIGSAPATVDSSDNSTGKVGAGQNDAVALQLFSTSSGIGQTINGKVITKAIFWMRRPTSSVTGTLYCRIWNTGASLTPVATIGSMLASAVNAGSSGSDWVAYTFTNTANTVAMANGYRIGIEYQGYGGDDVIDIQRKSSPSDTSAYQTTYNGDWDDDGNSSFSIKCDLYTGGTGTALISPWVTINASSQYIIAERFGSTSALNNKAPTKIEFKCKKKSGTTGTLSLQLVTSTGGLKTTLKTWNIATDPAITTLDPAAGVLNLVWESLLNDVIIATNERIVLTAGSTLNVGGEVYIMSNKGNNAGANNHNSSTSYIEKRSSTGSWSTYDSTLDITGKITTGGNNFDAFLRFGTSVSRITTKIVNISSGLSNKKITKVLARMRKFGTPGGIINCFIRDASDNIKVTFSSIDANILTTSYADYEFINVVHNYLTNNGGTTSGDKISFEYAGADTSHYVELNSNKDVYDGLNTITQTYGANYTDLAQRDLAGKTFTGGEPDLNSRTRVAQSIEHQNSRLKGKKLTRIKAFLTRTSTTTSGTAYCNIRGTNDTLVKTLGTVAVSSLSTAFGTPSAITFEDLTNNYPMNVGDKVTIEFNGGDGSNNVWVLVRTVDPNYDLTNSYIRKFDEVDYDDEEPTKDLCAVMDEGGFFFTPDPNVIPDPTPVNDKDLIICAGNNKLSGFLEAFIMEFRIYTKDITLQMADNLYDNRYSISSVGSGEILMPFSLRAITLDEV